MKKHFFKVLDTGMQNERYAMRLDNEAKEDSKNNRKKRKVDRNRVKKVIINE